MPLCSQCHLQDLHQQAIGAFKCWCMSKKRKWLVTVYVCLIESCCAFTACRDNVMWVWQIFECAWKIWCFLFFSALVHLASQSFGPVLLVTRLVLKLSAPVFPNLFCNGSPTGNCFSLRACCFLALFRPEYFTACISFLSQLPIPSPFVFCLSLGSIYHHWPKQANTCDIEQQLSHLYSFASSPNSAQTFGLPAAIFSFASDFVLEVKLPPVQW